MSSSLIFKKFKLNTKIYFGNNSIKKLNYILNSDKILIVSSKKGKIRLLKNSNILKKKNIDFIETIDSYPSLKYVNKIQKKSFGIKSLSTRISSTPRVFNLSGTTTMEPTKS